MMAVKSELVILYKQLELVQRDQDNGRNGQWLQMTLIQVGRF